MKRGTAVVLTTALVAFAAVLLLVFVVQISSSKGAKNTLGDETFVVGPSKALRNQVPFLFQDLRNKELDVWVNYADGTWVTFLAHVEGDRKCQLKPKGAVFVDCHGKRYPANGDGQPHYKTSVDSKGRLVVDFTQ